MVSRLKNVWLLKKWRVPPARSGSLWSSGGLAVSHLLFQVSIYCQYVKSLECLWSEQPCLHLCLSQSRLCSWLSARGWALALSPSSSSIWFFLSVYVDNIVIACMCAMYSSIRKMFFLFVKHWFHSVAKLPEVPPRARATGSLCTRWGYG